MRRLMAWCTGGDVGAWMQGRLALRMFWDQAVIARWLMPEDAEFTVGLFSPGESPNRFTTFWGSWRSLAATRSDLGWRRL